MSNQINWMYSFKMGLNARQKLFISHYLKTKNATESAKLAGYSEKTAKMHGSRLMTNDAIKAEIEQKLAKVSNKLEISAERVLNRISEFAFGKEHCEPRDVLKANEMLGKHLKLFTEKVEVSGYLEIKELTDNELDARINALATKLIK